jgi:hypothetical protein
MRLICQGHRSNLAVMHEEHPQVSEKQQAVEVECTRLNASPVSKAELCLERAQGADQSPLAQAKMGPDSVLRVGRKEAWGCARQM